MGLAPEHHVDDQHLIGQAIDAICAHFADEDERTLIRQAADVACGWHAEQRRKSGEPFVLHPLEVARILAEEGLSAETACAGILHDVLEDTDCPPQLICTCFGEAVLHIVQGVTKITQVAPRGTPQREKLATYRKLVLAAAAGPHGGGDARTLLVKLADRLHNMRTIDAMKPARQEAIARETLDIFAPLAHRLGMARVREELQDLSLRVLEPALWEEAGALQRERQGRAGSALEDMAGQIAGDLQDAGIPAKVTMRVKGRFSIAQKIRRRGGDRTDIYDVLGVRVIVDDADPDLCYRAMGVVHRRFPPRFDRFHDYIAVPKANLYQSLHTTVLGSHGQPVEVQIRSRDMHTVAEHGIAAHWLYKETLSGGGPEQMRSFLSRAAKHQDRAPTLEEAFQALRDDVFDDEVYVLTPKGDVRILPAGSCAVDFAYAVHSELGHRCVGARVNGTVAPLTRALVNGDVVEVITSPTGTPSRHWLDHVQSARARQRIRQHFHSADDRELIDRGLALLSSALREADLTPLATPAALGDALRELPSSPSPDSVGAEIARDPSRLGIWVTRLVRHIATPARTSNEPLESVPEVRRRARQPMTSADLSGLRVDGMSGVQVRLAGCCAPEPGDELTGFVSLARGVTVHRRDCREMQRARAQSSPRLLDVSWDAEISSTYRGELDVVFVDRPGLMADLADCIAACGAEMAALHLDSDGRVVRGQVACVLSRAGHSDEVADLLRGLDGALKVGRVGRIVAAP